MFTESRINSIDIKITITFLRLTKIPNTPKVKMLADKNR
jgi:hypothetical protein